MVWGRDETRGGTGVEAVFRKKKGSGCLLDESDKRSQYGFREGDVITEGKRK